MQHDKRLGAGLAGIAALCVQFDAFAGTPTVITYGTPTAAGSVPTLSPWGAFALALLIGVVGYRVLREKLGGRPLAAIFLAAALAGSAFFGGLEMEKAMAVVPSINLSNPAGGTYSNSILTCGVAETATVTNTSGVPLQIQSLSGYGSPFTGSTCAQGSVLSNGGTCNLTAKCPWP